MYQLINKNKTQIKLSFKFYWMLYYIILTLIGAILISSIDKINFIDGLILSAGSVATAGLSTISMSKLSHSSFIIMAILICLGGNITMLLLVILYRIKCFNKIDQLVITYRENNLIPQYDELSKSEQDIIDRTYNVYNSLRVLSMILYSYFFIIHAIGIIIIYISLLLHPNIPELVTRGYSRLDNSVFLTISSFGNAGYAIASDSLLSLSHNPFAYMSLAVLILLGNTCIPVMLRLIIVIVNKYNNKKGHKIYQFLLDHSRSITTSLFNSKQTYFLIYMIILFNTIQYIIFLCSTINRKDALLTHTKIELAGLGYFQTVSTRSAGFNILDLRELNQGLIFVYCIMCYISTVPFLDISPDATSNYKINNVINPLVDNRLDGKANDQMDDQIDISKHKTNNQIYTFFNKLIFQHTFMLLLSVFICSFSEDGILTSPNYDVNLWYVIFEIVSAYGSVGLSMGFPGKDFSLCGMFTNTGKLVIIFVMLLGKHRGLPDDNDEAIDFKFMDYQNACRVNTIDISNENPIITNLSTNDDL